MAQDHRDQNTYTLNYRFDNKNGRSLNIDADYGHYLNESERQQPNRYYDADETTLLTEVINAFNTPTEIDIYTFKVDYEDALAGGVLGLGTKLSRVVSDNSFLFYDVLNAAQVLNNRQSNRFEYDENVYAAYVSYARPLG